MPGPDGTTVEIPIDTSRPNPNGEEYDCLYLDMNGIVHPCTHPEGKPAPETEEDMMTEVFAYTDRVVTMIRPRKLLMLAIDGVAPRAKMNQQRSRRFRSAQDAKILHGEKERELEERKKKGLAQSDEEVKRSWDSNAITPGTPFMDLLAQSLRYWIAHKLNTDPGWKNLCVVLSDASVPGEGEHKIMDYIRRKRSDPHHDPNMRHVIYGLDADLIMLSLATHEPHFKVLREDVFAQDAKNKGCHRCGQEGHMAVQCTGQPRRNAPPTKKGFIFLDVPTLREYLNVELQTPGITFPFNLERAIDDWVFLIFFVGNDFLPHLPSLEIREGAIDTLLKIWKRELPRMTGYVTHNGKVELANAQFILDGLMQEEDEIFRRRHEEEERQNARKKRNEARHESHGDEISLGDTTYVSVSSKSARPTAPPVVAPSKPVQGNRGKGPVLLDGDSADVVKNRHQIRMANISAAESLRAELAGKKGTKRQAIPDTDTRKRGKGSASDESLEAKEEKPIYCESLVKKEKNEVRGGTGIENESEEQKTRDAGIKQEGGDESSQHKEMIEAKKDAEAEEEEAEADEEDEDDAPPESVALKHKVNADGTVEYVDTIKLYEPGYRERYYRQKFGVELSDTQFRRKVVQAYVEGLCWVLAYYYQGCPSWKWYYPYHYAPFAADFTDLASIRVAFTPSEPFRPFEQLMGVLPAASRKNLPEPFQWLMTNEDSEIIDFYPTEFQIDMNGKKMAWQGVALLPFIDETRLLNALQRKYSQLTDDERRRNSFGRNVLFVSEDADLFSQLSGLYAKRSDERVEPIDTTRTSSIAGTVSVDPACIPGSTFYTPIPTQKDMGDITNDRSLSVRYDFPTQTKPHRSALLRGVCEPPRRLTPADADWVRRGGRSSGGGGRGRRRDGWNDQGAFYGCDAQPYGFGRIPSAPYGGGPYGGGPYGGGPYGSGPYGNGPYGSGPYSAGPYGSVPYGVSYGANSCSTGPYGSSPYGAAGYAGNSYGAGYGRSHTGPYGAGPYGSASYNASGYGNTAGYAYNPAFGYSGAAYGSGYGGYGVYGQGNPYSGYSAAQGAVPRGLPRGRGT